MRFRSIQLANAAALQRDLYTLEITVSRAGERVYHARECARNTAFLLKKRPVFASIDYSLLLLLNLEIIDHFVNATYL